MSSPSFTMLDWGSKVSCPMTLPRKTQRIRCGSNSEPLHYESNTTSEPPLVLSLNNNLKLALFSQIETYDVRLNLLILLYGTVHYMYYLSGIFIHRFLHLTPTMLCRLRRTVDDASQHSMLL